MYITLRLYQEFLSLQVKGYNEFDTMKIIIGLGNPGKKYQFSRHNIGFRIIDELAKKYHFPNFEFSKKFNAEINKSSIGGQEIILAKPQTFMNLSGKAGKLLMRWRKLECQDLVVVHDDVDLSLGKIRIVKNRGAAGHKGVESIIKELGTKDFIRVRIGINPNEKLKALDTKGTPRSAVSEKQLEKFVLEKFNREEEKVVKEVIQNATEAIETALEKSIEKAMNKYNPLIITPKRD